jgi:protein SCO1
MSALAAAVVLTLGMLAWPTLAWAHEAVDEQRLPTIGPAPQFALTSQDGARVTLAEFRGKVVAVAFIYTSCPDVCPLLTAKMAQVQDELGSDFGSKVAFVSISVDPENDTPEALQAYAEAHGADLAGWTFLTGAPAAVREAARRYGVAVSTAADGRVDHTLLTTLVDRRGAMRVQYIGYRFDPEEFRRDLLSLLDEP